jgi:hypothetical protein
MLDVNCVAVLCMWLLDATMVMGVVFSFSFRTSFTSRRPVALAVALALAVDTALRLERSVGRDGSPACEMRSRGAWNFPLEVPVPDA